MSRAFQIIARRHWVAACLGLLLAAVAGAAVPTGAMMLKNIRTTVAWDPCPPSPLPCYGIQPIDLVPVGSSVFFQAYDAQHGYELWTSDGTYLGTRLVKDIYPGPQGASISALIDVNGIAYFAANDAVHGLELWKSDGTASGTVLVKDMTPGDTETIVDRFINVDGTLYFKVIKSEYESALWKSDGTESGTVQLKQDPAVFSNNNGTSSAVSFLPIKFQGMLYFISDNGSSGAGLWKSDGTASGTILAVDLGQFGGDNLMTVKGVMYFAAHDGLWKSDGTETGTVLVKAMVPGLGWSGPRFLTDIDGTLYFIADDREHGFELWKSDGTEAGTMMVRDIRPGIGGSIHENPQFTNVGGTLYFRANDGAHGHELWKSDGTEAGTVLVKDLWSGCHTSYIDGLANVNGTLFFSAADVANYIPELWKSDGTAAGTVMVKDILPGTEGAGPQMLNTANGLLYFTANDGTHGRELWTSDGTAIGTTLLKDIWHVASSIAGASSEVFTDIGDTVFFAADNGANGTELWKSSGAEASTVMVRDIFPASAPYSPYYGSFPEELTEVNGTLYFRARDNDHGRELWRSDGTESGTEIVKDIGPTYSSSTPHELTNVNGTLFFSAWDLEHGNELWKSDGTEVGTLPVKDILPGSDSYFLDSFTNVSGALLFRVNDLKFSEYGPVGTSRKASLWTSNGSESGTVPFKNVVGNSPIHNERIVVGNTLYFTAVNESGAELWKSDGTESGTKMVKDISPDTSYYSPWPTAFTNVNGTLFFTADDEIHGPEVWKSNGTEMGTVMVKGVQPDTILQAPLHLTDVNGTLYFSANTGTEASLWRSDGSDSGTGPIKALYVQAIFPVPEIGGALLSAYDGGSGVELWITDGTPGGTRLLQDISVGVTSSSPASFRRAGDIIYFTADDGCHGREPWGVTIADLIAAAANQSVFVSVSSNCEVLDFETVGDDDADPRPNTDNFSEFCSSANGYDGNPTGGATGGYTGSGGGYSSGGTLGWPFLFGAVLAALVTRRRRELLASGSGAGRNE